MTESEAPDISVIAHLEESTRVDVRSSDSGDGAWLSFEGSGYPSVSIWMPTEKMAEVRDTITAYLGSGEVIRDCDDPNRFITTSDKDAAAE